MAGSPTLTEFLIEKPNGRSTPRLFTAHPTPLEENNLGRLFGVLEIESTDAVNADILDVIIHTLNTQYYQSETFEIESAFEFALQKTNNKLQELIGEIGEGWLSRMNIVLGVQKDKKLIFTHVGKVIAIMVHKGNGMDVLDSAQSKAADINPVKIFGHIVSGEIPADSMMIFATESMLNYLSKEKIKRVLIDHEPEFAVKEFHTLLSEDTTNTNFAAVIIKRASEKVTSPSAVRTQQVFRPNATSAIDDDSMIALMGKQHQTEELLTPSILPSLKKALKQKVATAKREGDEVESDAESSSSADVLSSVGASRQPGLRRNGASRGRGNGFDVNTVLRIISKGLQLLLSGVVILFGWAKTQAMHLVATVRGRKMPGRGSARSYGSSLTGTRRFGRSTPDSIGVLLARAFSRIVRWFQSLSVIQKTFFVVAVAVFLIFAQSVISRGEEKVTNDQEQQYAQKIADIDVKLSEGKAALLYDKEAARNLFVTAQQMLAGIPAESKIYKSRGVELAGVITEQLRLANSIVSIPQPTVAADFASVSSSVSRLLLLGRSIYAFDENTSAVYRHNLEEQKTTVAFNADPNTPAPIAVSKASVGTGVSVMKNGSFAFFSPIEDQFTPLALSYANTSRNIVDIAVFGTRLYTLDVANKQVFRHQKSGDDTFGAGAGWITDSTVDVKDGVSFAIDGSVYVLRGNGQVVKLSSGTKDAFALTVMDPALDAATQIFADENTKNIYILDPSDHRLVAVDKQGKLVAQYTSDSFNNLKDMLIDEPNKKAYLLNGSQVFAVDLQ